MLKCKITVKILKPKSLLFTHDILFESAKKRTTGLFNHLEISYFIISKEKNHCSVNISLKIMVLRQQTEIHAWNEFDDYQNSIYLHLNIIYFQLRRALMCYF